MEGLLLRLWSGNSYLYLGTCAEFELEVQRLKCLGLVIVLQELPRLPHVTASKQSGAGRLLCSKKVLVTAPC